MDRYFEDFAVGERFETPGATISRQEALAFASSYDPQPFHLDDAAARDSLFGTLVVSGWQTAAITMRLIVLSRVLEATGVIGTGIDELRWLAPVLPGDTLRVRGEIVGLTPPPAGRRRGSMRVQMHAVNQNDAIVYSAIANLIVPVRPD
ncbi:MAG: MaoC/PaaZ C-terminal domain-containing protein [Vulcanimicrobiaceae bacterium]